jgi:hypothetical protein
MLNYNSIYKWYSNKSINWLPMDTEGLYHKNLVEQKTLLEKNNWIDYKFTYTFNSYGFRCTEFINKPTIMFLGCSFTCGIGLPIDTIWPELVTKQLNMQCANLGQGGGSSDTAFRLCLGWIDKINPEIIILLKPPRIRWELVNEKKIEFIRVNDITPMDHLSHYMRKYCEDDNNDYFNTQKNIFAIEHLCHQRRIKFLNFETKSLANKNNTDDLARDLAHNGVKSNQQFANHVINNISSV